MNAARHAELCGGAFETVAKAGMRGYRVVRCQGACGYEGVPFPVAAERRRARMARDARHQLRRSEGFVPLVPAVRRHRSEGKDMSVPRGERD